MLLLLEHRLCRYFSADCTWCQDIVILNMVAQLSSRTTSNSLMLSPIRFEIHGALYLFAVVALSDSFCLCPANCI